MKTLTRAKLALTCLAASALSASLARAEAPAAEATLIAAPASDELLGVVSYSGGFRNRLRLELREPKLIKAFRVAVPSFCGNLDILEAGTVSEGVDDAATARSGHPDTFVVNGGAGMRVSAVYVTFNGPTTQTCDVPVFAIDADDPDPRPGECMITYTGTQDLFDRSWPGPVWSQRDTQRFYDYARWARTQTASLPATRDFMLTSNGGCFSYLRIAYDREVCRGDVAGDTYATQYMGETVNGTKVERLFGLVSALGRYNVCVQMARTGVRFGMR